MLSDSAIFSATVYFSYNQFFVFDKSIKLPACTWTERHFNQGFARREKNAVFGSLLEFGYAELAVYLGAYKGRDAHERVIEVPIEVSSGEVVIAGPEEFDDTRVVKLAKGHYRLVVAQTVTDEDRETIDLYFEKLAAPLTKSQIIVADDALHPPSPLIDTADEVVA